MLVAHDADATVCVAQLFAPTSSIILVVFAVSLLFPHQVVSPTTDDMFNNVSAFVLAISINARLSFLSTWTPGPFGLQLRSRIATSISSSSSRTAGAIIIFFKIFNAPNSAEDGPTMEICRTALHVYASSFAALKDTPLDSMVFTRLFGFWALEKTLRCPAPNNIPMHSLDIYKTNYLWAIDMSVSALSSVENGGEFIVPKISGGRDILLE